VLWGQGTWEVMQQTRKADRGGSKNSFKHDRYAAGGGGKKKGTQKDSVVRKETRLNWKTDHSESTKTGRRDEGKK